MFFVYGLDYPEVILMYIFFLVDKKKKTLIPTHILEQLIKHALGACYKLMHVKKSMTKIMSKNVTKDFF